MSEDAFKHFRIRIAELEADRAEAHVETARLRARVSLMGECIERLLLAVDASVEAHEARASIPAAKLDDMAQLLASVAARVRKELGR